MYVIETRIKTRSNKTIWMPYKQYRTTNGIENFQKRHQYLFDAGELRVTGNAEPRQSHTKSGKGLLRVGDILHESYGYDMTINKFYEVIALSPSGKTCTIQPIHKITIKGDAYSPYGSEVVPQTEGEDRFCDEPIKGKRVTEYLAWLNNQFENALDAADSDVPSEYQEGLTDGFDRAEAAFRDIFDVKEQ